MNIRPIETVVAEIISEHLGVPVHTIKPESKLIQDLGADSLDLIEMCMSIEDEFNIEIPDDEAEKLVTVQDVLTKVGEGVAAKAS